MPGADRRLRNRISLKTTVSNSLTMAYRTLLIIRRTPQQLFDVTIQPILFTLMFTFLFGGAISGSVTGYLPIIIPGILAQTAITASMATGVQLREDMDKGVFYRFKSMPIARIAPLTGPLVADMVRYSIATALTFAMGYALGFRWNTPAAALLAGSLAVFAAWCLSWVFALLGVVMKTAQAVQGISAAVIFPLSFLSGAFVPTKTLPWWLQAFVNINPLTYVVSAVRELLTQNTVGTDFWLSLVGSTALALIFAPITLRAYMRKA